MAKKTAKTKKVAKKVEFELSDMEAKHNSLQSAKSPSGLKNKKYLVLAAALLILVLALGYRFKGLFLAATVGGKPIMRLTLDQTLEKQSGKQALENLIDKELIVQEAGKKNVTVTAADVDNEINRIKGMLTQQGTTLDAALTQQGQTLDELKDNIKLQKLVEVILKDKLGVSDDDVKKYFDTNKTSYGKDAKFDDLKDQIKQQLTQQKLSTEYTTWMAEVRKNAKIMYFMHF